MDKFVNKYKLVIGLIDLDEHPNTRDIEKARYFNSYKKAIGQVLQRKKELKETKALRKIWFYTIWEWKDKEYIQIISKKDI